MRNKRVVFLLAAAGSLWLACSSSDGPAPTVAGTWHVAFGTLNNGFIHPPMIDAVVSASGDSFLVTLPTITWSVGVVAYDSAAEFVVTQDSFVVFDEMIAGSAHVCDFVAISGVVNQSRDTVRNATVIVGDTDTTGGFICKSKSSGPATVTKAG